MEIRTKFNIGDTVWSVTPNCETTTGTVRTICVDKGGEGQTEFSYMIDGMASLFYKEEQLCASYEELLRRVQNSRPHEEE